MRSRAICLICVGASWSPPDLPRSCTYGLPERPLPACSAKPSVAVSAISYLRMDSRNGASCGVVLDQSGWSRRCCGRCLVFELVLWFRLLRGQRRWVLFSLDLSLGCGSYRWGDGCSLVSWPLFARRAWCLMRCSQSFCWCRCCCRFWSQVLSSAKQGLV